MVNSKNSGKCGGWALMKRQPSLLPRIQNLVIPKFPAGTYTMFALPTETEWTIILNSQLGQWGAYSYEKNKEKNVARINTPRVKKLSAPVEQLTIRFEKDKTMIIEWDQTQVEVAVKPND